MSDMDNAVLIADSVASRVEKIRGIPFQLEQRSFSCFVLDEIDSRKLSFSKYQLNTKYNELFAMVVF